MANFDAPFGLKAVKGPSGTDAIPRRYWMSSASPAVGQGCFVGMDGQLATVVTSASSLLLGVAAYYVSSAKPTNTSPDYDESIAAADVRRKAVYVYDDPSQVYEVQSSAAFTVGGAVSYIGAYFSMINASTHNTTTLQSKGELDPSTANTTRLASRNLLCVGVADGIGRNDYDASWPTVLVQINPAAHVRSAKLGPLT